MFDLIIRNATIVDGTGAPRKFGDVAVKDGKIADVTENASIPERASREIDAEGDLLTPGFVDIHTHYDGQVCWDKQVTPSSWHGVTSIVMGNCGVGFAPVRKGTEDELVSLMESVEDIPGTALHEGIPWTWETFPEYLDAIDTPYAIDVGAQVPHVAIRHYVMGDRCYDDATSDDIEQMQLITREALKAGALGFSTSRFYLHLDRHGNVVPGTHASADEMCKIGDAFKELDHGSIEIISDHLEEDEELKWIERIARSTGRPLTTLAMPGNKKIWPLAESLRRDGLALRPQIGARPASILMTLDGTINPLRQYKSYREIEELPLSERQTLLKDSSVRLRILSDKRIPAKNRTTDMMMNAFDKIYVTDTELTYEPRYEDTVQSIALAKDLTPTEVIMDTFADGRPLLLYFRGYTDYKLEEQRKAIENPLSVFGLSDGGAHCGILVDASVPTYMIAYFTRDRKRGPLMNLESVVHKLSQDAAGFYGLNDRGVIAQGYKADLNLINYDALKLHQPEMVYDLPAGGKRLVQRADGYRATICAGKITYVNGEHTGEMPGRLIRGGSTDKQATQT